MIKLFLKWRAARIHKKVWAVKQAEKKARWDNYFAGGDF